MTVKNAQPRFSRDLLAGGLLLVALLVGIRRKQEFSSIGAAPIGDNALSRVTMRLLPEDWLVLGYLVVLEAAVLMGEGPRKTAAALITGGLLGVYLLLQTFAHSDARGGRFRETVRRISLAVGVIGTFVELHYVLPTATQRSHDAALYAIDLMMFGDEPAEAWERFVRPATTEWFSFFYFNYYTLIIAFMVPFTFLVRPGKLLRAFSFGLLIVFCLGQIVYILVPGYGPHIYLAGNFSRPLTGPFWWNLVHHAVEAGSVRGDIFPSLHTAVPTFLTLFAWRQRQHLVLRVVWFPLALVTSQIVIATMFLRWHYAIDILAGICLAVLAEWLGRRVASRETRSLPPIVWGPVVTVPD